MSARDEILDTPLEGDGVVKLHAASLEKRLINYLIDGVLWFFMLFLFIGFLATLDSDNPATDLLTILALFGGYPFYYFIFELTLKGKTPAKYITSTRAVHNSGAPIAPGVLVLRSLCRMVPFERFSFLVNYEKGWHDVWSKTMVIDEKQSVIPSSNKAIKHQNTNENQYLK